MQGFGHVGIPSGYYRIIAVNTIEQVRDYRRVYTGHITGRDEDELSLCCKEPA